MKLAIKWSMVLVSFAALFAIGVSTLRQPPIIFFGDDLPVPDTSEKAWAEHVLAVQTADPIRNANLSFHTQNRRFIGVTGRSVYFPGVENKDRQLLQTYGIKIIAGGGDYVTAEMAIIIDANRRYAERYNTEMIRLLKR